MRLCSIVPAVTAPPRSTIFIASSNVFSTGKRIQERYDLKGSVIGRRAMSPKAGAVDPTTVSCRMCFKYYTYDIQASI